MEKLVRPAINVFGERFDSMDVPHMPEGIIATGRREERYTHATASGDLPRTDREPRVGSVRRTNPAPRSTVAIVTSKSQRIRAIRIFNSCRRPIVKVEDRSRGINGRGQMVEQRV